MVDDNYVAVLRRYNHEEEKYVYSSITYADDTANAVTASNSYDYVENDVVFVCKTQNVTMLPYDYEYLAIFASGELSQVDMEDKVFAIYQETDTLENLPNVLIRYMVGDNSEDARISLDDVLDALKECTLKKHNKLNQDILINKIFALLKIRDRESLQVALDASSRLMNDEVKTIVRLAARDVGSTSFSHPENADYAFWLPFVARETHEKRPEYAEIVRRVIPIEKFLRAVVGR